MANLKVLMMGGRRCGKTSLLSSLFDQMIHTPAIYELLTVSDQTIPETQEYEWNGMIVSETQELLYEKNLNLKNSLKPINLLLSLSMQVLPEHLGIIICKSNWQEQAR